MLVLSLEKYPIKSFNIFIYDDEGLELVRHQVSTSVIAPFANRIAKEILNLPDWISMLSEPWYELIYRSDLVLQRSPKPPGLTSMHGEHYYPELDPAIYIHPDAQVHYFEVRLFNFQTELYRGIYTVDDIFLHNAHYLLLQHMQQEWLPKDTMYYYSVAPSGLKVDTVASDMLPEDTYKALGIFRLPPPLKEEPRIHFRPIPQSPLSEREPSSFNVITSYGRGEAQAGRVFIPLHLYEDLQCRLTLSRNKEEGGYILGNVYRSGNSPENEDMPGFNWIVEVTDLLMAEATIGSRASLLFTGETWSRVSRRRDRDYPERRIVGWFHTHLFPATDSFGLSSLDQHMHTWYLPRPWQVAILLNQNNRDERTVRCYQRGQQGDLVETPYEVFYPNSMAK